MCICSLTLASKLILLFLAVNSFDKLKSRLEEAFREAEAKEKKWRESAAETAERNKILEVE